MPQPWAWPPCCPPRKLLSYVNGALLPPAPPQHLIPCAAPTLDLRRGCGVSGTLSQRQEKVAGRRKDHKAGDKRSVPQGPYPGANSLREGPPLRSTCRVGFLRTSERWGPQVLQSPRHPPEPHCTKTWVLLAGPRAAGLGCTPAWPSACFLGSCQGLGRPPGPGRSPWKAGPGRLGPSHPQPSQGSAPGEQAWSPMMRPSVLNCLLKSFESLTKALQKH